MSDQADYIIKSDIYKMEEVRQKIILFVKEESIYPISRGETVIFLVKMTKDQAGSLKNNDVEMSIDSSKIKCYL
jgi:hypothetical protein